MNYYSPELVDMPFDNPITKIGICVAVTYVAYLGYKYVEKAKEDTPGNKRHRKYFTSNKIDNKIDHRNRFYGSSVPANPKVPFYSRHNYNRRRRSKNFW